MQYCALKYKHPSVFTKLRWFGHVVRSIGICKTILQGTVPGKNKSFSFSRVQELPFRLVSFNISEYHPLHVFLISPSSASVLHLFSFKHMLPVMSYGRLFLVSLSSSFPFVRGEVLPATFSPPHLIVFSTLLCLLSSSSSLPPRLPSSHLS